MRGLGDGGKSSTDDRTALARLNYELGRANSFREIDPTSAIREAAIQPISDTAALVQRFAPTAEQTSNSGLFDENGLSRAVLLRSLGPRILRAVNGWQPQQELLRKVIEVGGGDLAMRVMAAAMLEGSSSTYEAVSDLAHNGQGEERDVAIRAALLAKRMLQADGANQALLKSLDSRFGATVA